MEVCTGLDPCVQMYMWIQFSRLFRFSRVMTFGLDFDCLTTLLTFRYTCDEQMCMWIWSPCPLRFKYLTSGEKQNRKVGYSGLQLSKTNLFHYIKFSCLSNTVLTVLNVHFTATGKYMLTLSSDQYWLLILMLTTLGIFRIFIWPQTILWWYYVMVLSSSLSLRSA